MSRKYLKAYYLDAKDGRPANEAPLRHGPVKPSENIEITVVDRRESPAVILGSIPSSESLAAGMTLIKKDEHDRLVAEVESWKVENELQELEKRRRGMVVTMRQARLALLKKGLLDQVQPAIDSLPEPDRRAADIEWEYGATVERDNALIQSLTPAMGMTDTEVDDLFKLAATL